VHLYRLSSIFFVVELVGGIITGSLALESDAFHMASDVIALLIGAVAASMVGRVAESAASTYGYLRGEVVAGLVNGVFLLAVCFIIFIEALQRFSNIEEVKRALKGQEDIILIIGSLGLAFNLAGLLGFHAHSHAGHDHSHGGHKHVEDAHSPLMHDDVELQLYSSISTPHNHDHGHDHGHGISHAEHSSSEHDHRKHAHATAAVHADAHDHSASCAHQQQQHYQRSAAIETHSGTTAAGTTVGANSSDGDSHAHKHESRTQQFTAAAVTATKAKQSISKSHGSHSGAQSCGHSKGHDSHGHDANTHGIILHILGDALGSVAVIISALIIKYCTGLGDYRYYFDPLASIAITIFLTFHTVPFVRSCIYILLQRAPEWLDVAGLKKEVCVIFALVILACTCFVLRCRYDV
jgi:solute carrier family 30 (zinc transporter), member 1